MAVKDADFKILWGRAAGRCSNPACGRDLTADLSATGSIHIGEMAHVIAKRDAGPRGVPNGGSDTYDNLILLCPTDHTTIDKAPDDFSVELLQRWKSDHEADVQSRLSGKAVANAEELKRAVARLLAENKSLWAQFGPHSKAAQDDPASNLSFVWELRKVATLVPNNQKIVSLVQANEHLISKEEFEAFMQFKAHATAYAQHCISPLDTYPLFPKEFAELFS